MTAYFCVTNYECLFFPSLQFSVFSKFYIMGIHYLYNCKNKNSISVTFKNRQNENKQPFSGNILVILWQVLYNISEILMGNRDK